MKRPRVARRRPMRARFTLMTGLLTAAAAWASFAALADGSDQRPSEPPPEPARVDAILGTAFAQPDDYLEPGALLKPHVTLADDALIAGPPVRQHPVLSGSFDAGCAQCHRLAAPLPTRAGATPDVFDTIPAKIITSPPPAGFVQVTNDPARNEYPTWSPSGDAILFERRGEDERWSLWIVRPEGSNARELIPNTNAGWGEWSPDGAHIVFWAEDPSGRGGNVWLVDAAGDEPRQLTHAEATAFPTWSPDGRRIAYQAKDDDGTWALWLLDPDGGEPHRITPPGQALPSRPQFSPDGHQIAYQVADSGRFGLWRLVFPSTPDGTPDYQASPRSIPSFTLLPMDLGLARNNSLWSPDGRRLALQVHGLTPTHGDDLFLTYKTWTTDPQGANPRLLMPTDTLADRSPSFSPTGRWLILWSWNHDLTASVWLASADGSAAPLDLTSDLGGDSLYPSWSPDGTRVTFSNNRGGTFDIWIVDVGSVVPGFLP